MATSSDPINTVAVEESNDFRGLETSIATLSLLQEEIEELKEECKEFSILAAGKFGAGKSTLLNALTESDVFKSSPDRNNAGTKYIEKYEFIRKGVTITAWDSPGFQDSSGKEDEYKKELTNNCSEVDLVLYCISLKETRSDLGDDASALKQITDALTVDVWQKSVIVLTYANKLESRLKLDKTNLESSFARQMDLWKEKVQIALRECGVKESVIEQIPIVPAGHLNRKHLPGQRYWLSNLWFKILNAVKNEYAQLALQKANEDRFIPPEKGETSSPYALVITKEKVIAAAAGTTIGVAGAAVGGTTGALIGALAIGIPTFGVAAGVGLVLGLAVGAGIGGGIGGGVAALVKKVREKRRKRELEESTASQDETD